MKKKTKIVTSTLITITAAVLCAAILITVITHRDWFAASSSTNSDTPSMIETIIIEQTASEETTTSETEPEPQETSSQQPTSQPSAPSKPAPPTSSNNSTGTTSSGNNKNQVYHPISGLPFKQLADPETGISWDGVSPIIYTYEDGTTGTEKRDGAKYEYLPGWNVVYKAVRDSAGREYGTICQQCGKEVGNGCSHSSTSYYCVFCGKRIPADTCHECNKNGDIRYCSKCGKVSGDGSNGTCERNPLISGDWVHDLCGATVLGASCHTCGVAIDPLPGTAINSPSQLSSQQENDLYYFAERCLERQVGTYYGEEIISMYTFKITDRSLISTQSDCVCVFFYKANTYDTGFVYHRGLIVNISVSDSGNVSCSGTASSLYFWNSEAEALEYFKKYGTDFKKIK